MPYFPHFGRNENFCLKMGSVSFTCLLKPNSLEKIRKKLSYFWENSVTDRSTKRRIRKWQEPPAESIKELTDPNAFKIKCSSLLLYSSCPQNIGLYFLNTLTDNDYSLAYENGLQGNKNFDLHVIYFLYQLKYSVCPIRKKQ